MPLLTIPPIFIARFNNGVRGQPSYGCIEANGWGNGFIYEAYDPTLPHLGLRAKLNTNGLVVIATEEQNRQINLGTGDFTLDWFEYITRGQANSAALMLNPCYTGIGTGWNGIGAIMFGYRGTLNGDPLLYMSSNGTSWDIASGVALGSNRFNQWTHYTISRKDGTFYILLQGQLLTSFYSELPLFSNEDAGLDRLLWGGRANYAYLTGSSTYPCYVDEICLTDYCRYDSDFTPISEEYTISPQTLLGYVPVTMDFGIKSQEGDGIVLTPIISGIKNRLHESVEPLDLVNGIRSKALSASLVDPLTSMSKAERIISGVRINDTLAGIRSTVYLEGVSVDPIDTTSNADDKFHLLVTPTHQYKNQLVKVEASNSYGFPLLGRYQLEINSLVVIPYGPNDSDLRSISFDLYPYQLADGVNKCIIHILYPDSSRQYLDFEIVKEDAKRTQVERLFRKYDGGYRGDRLNAANKYGEIHPCFLAPDGSASTLIKTTDFTSISLQKYLDIQGVNIDAEGARIMVSFDKGITWKSRIDGSWQSVDLSNIATYGMNNEAINSITLAQWSAAFKPTSLDFAIYLDNSLSNYYDYSSNKLMGTYSGTTSYTYLYPQAGYRLTDIVYTLKGNGSQSSQTYPTNYSVLWGYVGATMVLNKSSPYALEAGAYTFSNRLREAEYIVYWKGHNSVPTNSITVYQAPRLAYLKSINIQITPNLKTGYTFIM